MTTDDTVVRSTMVRWTWQSTPIDLGMDGARAGPTVLLLPALSSISTRREMRPLMGRLASDIPSPENAFVGTSREDPAFPT